MNKQQLAAIEKHGRDLLGVFPGAIESDPVKLAKRVRRVEVALQRPLLDHCNGAIDGPAVDVIVDRLLSRANRILGNESGAVPVFVNRDPRGYALKICDEYVKAHNLTIHRDWGDDGILAPEITG